MKNQSSSTVKPAYLRSLKKVADRLFSTSAAGLYIILFALAIAVATFIENDFGTSAAQKMIFKTWWFELILLLFGGSLIANIFRFRMIQQRKWAILTFHLAMIVILIGAAVTRYSGSEGMMHIREGSASNTFLSADTYLHFEGVHEGRKYVFDEPVLFASLGSNRLKRSYLLGDDRLTLEVLNFVPNPEETLVEDPAGVPVLNIVLSGAQGREEYPLVYGRQLNMPGMLFNFSDEELPGAFNIRYENEELQYKSNTVLTQMQMSSRQLDTLSPGTYRPLQLRSLYSNGLQSFVFSSFVPSGTMQVTSSNPKMASNSMGAVGIRLRFDGKQQEFYIFGSQGTEGKARMVGFGNSTFAVSYGAKRVELPFSIALHDFIMERYPGTNSASSYASEVTLKDPRHNLERDQRIYMNHILNYNGYRFFQSSYDKDELGTYLSVNHDAWGTWISYAGYFLLTLGMILTLFSQRSRFRQLARKIRQLRPADTAIATVLVGIMLLFGAPAYANAPVNYYQKKIDLGHAGQFGRLLVQDYNGRMKPMNTFTNEILRKLSRKETFYGMTSEQVLLSMVANPKEWAGIPLLKIGKDEQLRQILQTQEDYIAYQDLFDAHGNYLLQEQVEQAYNAQPRDRGNFEKELLKLDEKVNICNMVFTARFMRVFPVPGDPNNHWKSPEEVPHHHSEGVEPGFAETFFAIYFPTLNQAIQNDDWTAANKLLAELDQYQQANGGEVLPAPAKVKAELLLNRMNIFSRLGRGYALLGLFFLVLLFISVFNPRLSLKWPGRLAMGLLFLSFALYTVGLGLRWYVSGRAPWSNGYESMIYIGWTTMLAGIIFARKSYGGLAATSILASTILMVAGLSWLDPEITPLVPVLKSYWLTIHVSLVAGSYGFLMLGAILGVLNLIFMILRNQRNQGYVNRVVKEMTYISEMTLIGGLIMLSLGTYLGGVWANESWGRYWGWDAKETWALVTILVYSFILHMRFIPGLRGAYAFNVGTLFGLASVMMTYFGVNYYLSGLHSYAAGDPVPIPSFVYYSAFMLIAISGLAYWRNRQYAKT